LKIPLMSSKIGESLMKQNWHKKTVLRSQIGVLPKDKTAARKGKVGKGWHKQPKSEMQLISERNRRNSL
jgi:hypothetical protein